MKLTKEEQAILEAQYQKIVEQIDEQGFVNQLLGADVIQRLTNLASIRLAIKG